MQTQKQKHFHLKTCREQFKAIVYIQASILLLLFDSPASNQNGQIRRGIDAETDPFSFIYA